MEITAQLVFPSMNANIKVSLQREFLLICFKLVTKEAQAPQLDVGGDLQCHCCLLDGGDSLKVDALWHFSTKSKKE